MAEPVSDAVPEPAGPAVSAVADAATAEPSLLRVELTWSSAIRAVVTVVVALVVVAMVQRMQSLLAMLAFSYFLSLAIEPAVRSITARTGWRRGAAVGVVYVGAVAFVGVLLAIVLPSIVNLANLVADSGGEWFASLDEWTSENVGFPVETTQATEATRDAAGALARFGGQVLGAVAGGVSLLFSLATLAMFTFYFSADAPRLQRAVLSGFGPAAQERILWTWDEAIAQTGAYFYSRVLLMLLNGTGFLVTMVLVGVPVVPAIALAVFGAFFAAFIPAVGTYIGSALPIAVTLALRGLAPALIVLGYAVVYQQVENYILVPRLSRSTMSLHGGIALGATFAGGAVAGALGAFVALPVAALAQSLIVQYGRSHEVVRTSTYTDDRLRRGPTP